MLKINIKLKEILKERGITQKELEAMSGVNQARISQLCKEGRKEVSLPILEKIAHSLEITDMNILLKLEEEDTNE